MRHTRVKICGMTRPEDASAAAGLGADAVGLVFHPGSRRYVEPETARRIVLALPPFVTAVGLFVDAPAPAVREVLARVPLGMLQFHGDEGPEYCASFGRPFLKAVPMADAVEPRDYARRFSQAAGLVLDGHGAGRTGGTGRGFDWARVPGDLGIAVVLAGGLGPANVEQAVARVRPYAVDVSSGVEQAPGVKDAELMRAFMRGVERGESQS